MSTADLKRANRDEWRVRRREHRAAAKVRRRLRWRCFWTWPWGHGWRYNQKAFGEANEAFIGRRPGGRDEDSLYLYLCVACPARKHYVEP